jgi:16S rRNA G1207 methylase RsmC
VITLALGLIQQLEQQAGIYRGLAVLWRQHAAELAPGPNDIAVVRAKAATWRDVAALAARDLSQQIAAHEQLSLQGRRAIDQLMNLADRAMDEADQAIADAQAATDPDVRLRLARQARELHEQARSATEAAGQVASAMETATVAAREAHGALRALTETGQRLADWLAGAGAALAAAQTQGLVNSLLDLLRASGQAASGLAWLLLTAAGLYGLYRLSRR